MSYKVNILTKCENEEETCAIISAALSIVLEQNNQTRAGKNGLIVKNMRRIPVTSPEWGRSGRHERFERKLNT